MTKIGGTETISHSAKDVFEALRDHLTEMVPFMPNVNEVDVKKREERPSSVYFYNRWVGAETEVPRAIRPFISKEMLTWFDHAEWHESRLACDWSIESGKAKDIFECSGTTSLTPNDDGSCTFTVDGDLSVDAAKIPGLPKFLGKKLRDPIERFVANMIGPNLTSTASAVQDYLDAKNNND